MKVYLPEDELPEDIAEEGDDVVPVESLSPEDRDNEDEEDDGPA